MYCMYIHMYTYVCRDIHIYIYMYIYIYIHTHCTCICMTHGSEAGARVPGSDDHRGPRPREPTAAVVLSSFLGPSYGS